MKELKKTYSNLKHIAYLSIVAVLVTSLVFWQTPLFAEAEEYLLQSDVVAEGGEGEGAGAPPEAPAVDSSEGGNAPAEEVTDEAGVPGSELPLPDATDESSDEGMVQALAEVAPLDAEIPATTQAEVLGPEGTCVVTFDSETGELTIGPGTLGSHSALIEWAWHTKRSAIKSVTFAGDVSAGAGAAYMFGNMTRLTAINNLDRLDTSATTNMAYMFYNCSGLNSLDFSRFNTAQVTDMTCMFQNCRGLSSLDLSKFNTAEVEKMRYLFSGCSGLSALDFPDTFTTINVNDMCYMFENCNILTTLDLSNFNTASVSDMDHMFYNCKQLETLNISSFRTGSVRNMDSMFGGCNSLEEIDVSQFDTTMVQTMRAMFKDCTGLDSLTVSNFNTSANINMYYMFAGCTGLKTLDLSNFNTELVYYMNYMFDGCTNLESINMSKFNTPTLEQMESMFRNCSSLRTLDLSTFNTAKVKNMQSMFLNCSKLEQLKLGELFAFKGTNHALPTPSGNNADGKPFTGKWLAASDGKPYSPTGIPSNKADTYNAEIIDSVMIITGNPTVGSTLNGSLSNPGTYSWSYRWSYGDTIDGPFTFTSTFAQEFAITSAYLGKYMRCTASYGAVSISAVVGPVRDITLEAPALDSAVLASNGYVTLGYTTAATESNPYTHIIVDYQLDDGEWVTHSELAAASSSVEEKTAEVDMSAIFNKRSLPETVNFRIMAKNASGESDWSNTATLNASPQISVTVPDTMAGRVLSSRDIVAASQEIVNTGNLTIKVVNIAMSKNEDSHPASSWECFVGDDEENPLWQGDSSTSGPVDSSPTLAPGATMDLRWSGILSSTQGINLSSTPVPYGKIIYTVAL